MRKLFIQRGIQFNRRVLNFYLSIDFASYRQPEKRCDSHDEGTNTYAMSSALNLIDYPPVNKGLCLGKQSCLGRQ